VAEEAGQVDGRTRTGDEGPVDVEEHGACMIG
jgi:hypothetical protein